MGSVGPFSVVVRLFPMVLDGITVVMESVSFSGGFGVLLPVGDGALKVGRFGGSAIVSGGGA
ncbi:hypothetical protein KY285_008523 [Solanum tuberosum]|nr:hypothetical protein KY285_008523 [Solanum tuberosum]